MTKDPRSNDYGHNHKKPYNKKRTNQNKPEQKQQEEESWVWTIGKAALKHVILPVALVVITGAVKKRFK